MFNRRLISRADAIEMTGRQHREYSIFKSLFAQRMSMKATGVRRLATWFLHGGSVGDQRAGLYLLDDYDPRKRVILMIHGLGSSPRQWTRLSDALRGSPDLSARFQIWHVVDQTNAPMLAIRRRIENYLDDAWSLLDPSGDDPARSGMVLIGHSLGGVVARMLCVDSGESLWSSAFAVAPDAMRIDAADRDAIESTFRFPRYPGISRAIFMAAPHQGSATADRWIGRLFGAMVGGSAPETQTLRRLARDHPEMIKAELRANYRMARVNSISTLQTLQPVRVAAQALMPAGDIAYHTIAAVLAGSTPPSDGVVPLSSVLLTGAESTLVVTGGHNIYENEAAVAEVVRILRADIEAR